MQRCVEAVVPDSIADELGLKQGDIVVSINGQKLGDILDWHLAVNDEYLLLVVKHDDGSFTEFEIEKECGEELGIIFTSPTLDDVRRCQNRCLFCFVDQLPPNLRETLYVKDDDYRLSFLSGSYITLTNIREEDLERIASLHLSPLYVSVHSTDADLRCKLLGNKKAGDLMDIISRLSDAGIQFHTQAVICPGINDGRALEQTIEELLNLHPAVLTLAVVPAGLTAHRQELAEIKAFSQAEALQVLNSVERWQDKALKTAGTRFVFASDELYVLAGKEPPEADAYEDYAQLENGVGLIRTLYEDWEHWEGKLPAGIPAYLNITIATGVAAAFYLQPVVTALNKVNRLKAELCPLENSFFGKQVTVAGLLTYSDLVKLTPSDRLYLPSVMFKEGTDVFLDGHSVQDLSAVLNTEVRVVETLQQLLEDLFN